MDSADHTCWTMIRGAAQGSPADRAEFAQRYERIVRSYLGARWRGSPLVGEMDDAVQEVFIDCFRAGGVLERVEPERPGGFRAYLFGVARNVALRVERARAKAGLPLDSSFDAADVQETASVAFDRAWAQSLLRQAAKRMAERAQAGGEEARRRVELLQLRFGEDLPIREIAERWGLDAARLHREYARAREEFRDALRDVVQEHQPGPRPSIEREAERLISCFQ